MEEAKRYKLDITDAYKLLLDHNEKLSFGASGIDSILKYLYRLSYSGGLRTRIITEISGESGTGKTQFCMQLMLQSLLPSKLGGLGGSSYYISTQKSISESRFDEIKHSYIQKYPKILNNSIIEKSITAIHLTDKNKDELKVYIDELKKKLENHDNIRLLIIDSITAICYSFVGDENRVDHLERAKFLLELINTMKRLAYQYNMVIVAINNAVGAVEKTQSSELTNIPALGILWANSINQRLFLERKETTTVAFKRFFKILFSPSVPQAETEFIITKEGISTNIPS